MLVRGESLNTTMSQYLIDQIKSTPKIDVQVRTRPIELHGDTHLEAISIACDATGEIHRVPASALFIFIGAQPRTDWLEDVIQRDQHGFILTGPDLMRDGKRPRGWSVDRDPDLLETNIPGVFAVGDVRYGSIKRVASGVGEGSVAVQFVHKYLSKVS
jgi:thioredoxin reductase (NADPH)